MKKTAIICAASLLGLFSLNSQAHRAFLVPYETVVAGDNSWVTFDLASSNDIFNIDHNAPRGAEVLVITPDGKTEQPKNLFTGQLRTSFDVNLTQEGTYKIAVASGGLTARWETEDGKRAFWPERGAKADPAEFEKVVPKKAKNLEVSFGSRRIETFVTKGAPTIQALQPTNQGLELVPVTHPNDLLVSQPAEFKFIIDGKPAAGVKVSVIEGGSRYRNSPEEQTLESDKNGMVKVTWKKPGLYWLGASYKDEKAQKPAKIRSGSYSATFEVLPE